MSANGGIDHDLDIARAALTRAQNKLLRQLAAHPAWQAWQQLGERERNGDPIRSIDDVTLKARLRTRLDEAVPGWQALAGVEIALAALGAGMIAPVPVNIPEQPSAIGGERRLGSQHHLDARHSRAAPPGSPPNTPADVPANPTAQASHTRLGVRLDSMDVLQKIRSIEPSPTIGHARPPAPRSSTKPPSLPGYPSASGPERQHPDAIERPFVPPPWSNTGTPTPSRTDGDGSQPSSTAPRETHRSDRPIPPPAPSDRHTTDSAAMDRAARMLAIEAELDQIIPVGARAAKAASGANSDARPTLPRRSLPSRNEEPAIDIGYGEADVEIVVQADDNGHPGSPANQAVPPSAELGSRPEPNRHANFGPDNRGGRAHNVRDEQDHNVRDEQEDNVRHDQAMFTDEASVQIVQLDDGGSSPSSTPKSHPHASSQLD